MPARTPTQGMEGVSDYTGQRAQEVEQLLRREVKQYSGSQQAPLSLDGGCACSSFS